MNLIPVYARDPQVPGKLAVWHVEASDHVVAIRTVMAAERIKAPVLALLRRPAQRELFQ
jgi:hypothetical protein